MEKRKIIEVYAVENKEEDTAEFQLVKTEDTKLANETMKGLAMMLAAFGNPEDTLELEGDVKEC